MSHVTSSKAIVTDLDCLRAVVAGFPQLHWKEGQKTYNWYNRFQDDWGKQNEHRTARARGIDPSQYGKCDHAISMDGCPYEIGVTKRQDGEGWSLVWDVWRGQAISDLIGQDAEKLMCVYSAEYCRRYAQEMGLLLTTTELEDGNLKLEMIEI